MNRRMCVAIWPSREVCMLFFFKQKTAYEIADKLAESNNLMQIIEQAIDPLPARCQEVFRMSYLQGMHNKEIAQQLNCSQRTIEAHIYKALKLIRVTLKSTLGCLLLMLQLPIR